MMSVCGSQRLSLRAQRGQNGVLDSRTSGRIYRQNERVRNAVAPSPLGEHEDQATLFCAAQCDAVEEQGPQFEGEEAEQARLPIKRVGAA
jgi:hypothetical protein